MLLTRLVFITSGPINSDQGGEVDGPGRGGAPLPWDMDEPPANMFKEEVIMVMIRMIFVIFLSVF